MDTSAAHAQRPAHLTRWLEFIALFILAPIALWMFLPYIRLLTAVALFTVLGIVLLIRTPGFEIKELFDVGRLRETWKEIAAWSLLTAIIVFPLAYWAMGERFLEMPRERPLLLLMIWLFYPWFSVFGQEVIFRPLFFRRYGALFPNEWTAIAVNALVFAMAHMFYERWITFIMTFCGGLMFAIIYARTRSFATVFVLHWIAGGLIFTSGLGWYFFHGAIGR